MHRCSFHMLGQSFPIPNLCKCPGGGFAGIESDVGVDKFQIIAPEVKTLSKKHHDNTYAQQLMLVKKKQVFEKIKP